MVGIQAMALKSNTDAKQQSTAVQLAAEYSDMMRGNKAVAVGITKATNPYLLDNFKAATGTNAEPTEKCASSAGCTTTFNVATWEKYEWLARVSAAFPEAVVEVCYDKSPYAAGRPQWGCETAGTAVTGDSISIKIGWTRESTNKARVNTGNASTDANANAAAAFEKATRPSVIYIVSSIAGN